MEKELSTNLTAVFAGTLLLLTPLAMLYAADAPHANDHESQEPPAANSTIVLLVDQQSTTKPERWSFAVKEAGNYQVGLAWIAVDNSGSGVTVRVTAGGRLVKSVTAPPGTEVARFETRIEQMAVGDTIEVTATPSQKSAYRLGYQIAFATPTFSGISHFDIHDYGATGDGKTDDYAALKKALHAARTAGGGIIRCDGSKTYRIAGGTPFEFSGDRNIRFEGNGAKFVLHPSNEFAIIRDSENIQIDGLTVTYDPLPYYQGDIIAQSIADGSPTVDIEVPARYVPPKTGAYLPGKFARNWWRIDSPEPVGDGNVGDGDILYIEKTEPLGEGGRRIRVHVRPDMRARLQRAGGRATQLIVPEIDYGHRSDKGLGYVAIMNSGRIALRNIHVQSICNMGFLPAYNWGPVTFSNVDILTPHPETELHVSWRDGWHVRGNRFGVLIEKGEFDGGLMYDDLLSPHEMMNAVSEATGNKVCMENVNPNAFSPMRHWKIGDWVSLWDQKQSQRRGMGRITKLEQGPGTGFTVYLDKAIPPQAGDGKLIAMNEELLNWGMVVRNCSSTRRGRVATCRLRTPIHFKNCTWDNTHFWIYAGERRPRPRNVIFEDTYISDRIALNIDDAYDVLFRRCTLHKTLLTCESCDDVRLDGIAWVGSEGIIIDALKASTVYLYGNSTRNGSAEISPWVRQAADGRVIYSAPAKK